MGASLCTTGMGWIVSLLGLKVSLGTWAMALAALLLLPGFLWGISLAASHTAFHTAFIAVGVLIFLPFVDPVLRDD